MLKQLRWKFVFIMMSVVMGMLLIIFTVVFYFTAMNLDAQADSVLDRLHHSPSAPQALPGFTLKIDGRGGLTAIGRTHFDLSDQEFLEELLRTVQKQGTRTGTLKKYELKYAIHTGFAEQTIAFADISSHWDTLSGLIQISLAILVLGGGVFLALSILFARWAVAPVEKAWKQQRQFVSDASHELKTPLTVIMSNAELLHSDEWDESSKAQFSENILTMSHQMRHLVEGLLELARVDNGQVSPRLEVLKLSERLLAWALPFEPVLFEKGITLKTEIAPDISIQGSEHHLRQVVDILLDNAGKYGSAGIVRLSLVRQRRNHCLLTVSNPGAPIAQADLPRIFERFYRADEARERNGSFGLGLSIAKAIVDDYRGKIWAESNESGSCFFVLLPCL